jgi:RNA polymerase sigma-70 factor, ECF subfamily
MTQAEAAQPVVPVRMVTPHPQAPADARLRAVVAEEYDALWRALRRLGVAPASVEDAAQQVLLVLARRMEEVTPGAERAFLMGTAVRVASDFRKKQARSMEALADAALEMEPASSLNPEELLQARRARQLLDDVLARLPMDLRAVFVLVEFEQMTMAAIATALGLPPGTVASRLRRARAAFDEIVQELQARMEEGER